MGGGSEIPKGGRAARARPLGIWFRGARSRGRGGGGGGGRNPWETGKRILITLN